MSMKLEAGRVVSFRGETLRVVAFDEDGQVRLRDESGGEVTLTPGELVGDPSFGFEGVEDHASSRQQLFWEKLPIDRRAAALTREEHLREVLTGYKMGQPDDHFPGEPRAAYSRGRQEDRIKAKAAELGVHPRQVHRWLRAYRQAGQHPAALVSGHQTRISSRLGKQEAWIAEAIMRVARQRTNDSDITLNRVKDLVRLELNAKGHEDVALPGRTTFNRLVRRFAPELTRDAKQRRSDASRGTQRPFGKVVCTRPGQYVQIDITPFDILARSEVDGRELRLNLILALDLYSRAIVAARLVEVDPKGVDVTTLLLDIIHPVRPHPSWPRLDQDALLPYMGIPDGLLLAAHDIREGVPLLNLPPVLPEAVVVDNGMVFLSGQFRELCERLGIDIMLARPGTGSDKAHVERLFGHISRELAERLKGHVASRTEKRGKEVEGIHFLWEVQFEVIQWAARYYNCKPHDGLCHPRVPKMKLTPAEMFAFGVKHAGHLTVPLGRDAYYLALRTELRIITDTGVRIDGWQYDSDVLNPYRNAESPFHEWIRQEGASGNRDLQRRKWPFKVDARDPTVIHFQDPETMQWHEVPERDADWRSRPFQQEQLEMVKVVMEEREWAVAADGVQRTKREMGDAYAARVKQSHDRIVKQGKLGLTTKEKQEIARREAARAQQEEMTGKRRAAPQPPPIKVALDSPYVEKGESKRLFEVVGDDSWDGDE